MSYTPTNWQTGDVVSSVKLNKLENGVANAEPLIVTITTVGSTKTADYSGSEINEMALAGRQVITIYEGVQFKYVQRSGTTAVFTANSYNVGHKITITNSKTVTVGELSSYIKPYAGIPESDLASAVQNKLNAAPVFTITLTPTALDYSGIMDATPAEIYEAYTAGKRIRFWVPSMNAGCDVSEYTLFTVGNDTRVSAWANIVFDTGSSYLLMTVITEVEDSTYTTVIFPLGTPSANGESF